jgi:LacI family transcriptional regulator
VRPAAYHAVVATIADVARAAGVSIATVSRVLSPGAVPHPVRADTAERVRAAARHLNFVPSPLARGLAARRSGLIGLIVPDLADPHYPQIASGVEEGARDASLAVLICNTLGEQEGLSEYLMLLQARRVDAIVLSGGASLNAVELLALQGCEVPLVLIGRPIVHVPWPHVTIDNRDGARQATRHLVQAGRRRILHLGGPRTQTTMADRAAGYAEALASEAAPAAEARQPQGSQAAEARASQALESRGSPAAEALEFQGSRAAEARATDALESHGSLAGEALESDGSPEDGYRVLAARLDDRSRPAPDAVFAATDRLAIAALAVAADRHLHVPRDLAVIGFDDIPLAGQLRPSLSSMSQPAHELGRVAIAMAQKLAAGENVEPVQLKARLVARESTLGPGGRYS